LAAFAAIQEQMTTERIGADDLLRLRRQAIEPVAQINRAAGEEYLGARCQADHTAPCTARNTRDSAVSLTDAPTFTRTPLGSAISILPVRSSRRSPVGDRGSGAASSTGAASVVRPITPIGLNSIGSASCAGTVAFATDCQLYSRLSDRP
jgi:hypothetical protein